MTEERYALVTDNRTYYYLGSAGGPFFAHLDEDTVVPMSRSPEHGWWFVEGHPAALIEQEHPAGRDIVGWELIPEVAPTEGLPAALTVEEYNQLVSPPEDEDDPRAGLYRAKFQPRPATRSVVPGPFMRLDGAPPTRDGMPSWEARLPFALRYASEYRHLFPGTFAGFKDALAARLNELPGVNAYSTGSMKVFAKLRHEDLRLPRPRPPRKKVPRITERTIEVPLSPPVRDTVSGLNRALAKDDWNRLMDDYVVQVKDLTRLVVCSGCNGEGFVVAKDSR